MHYRLAVFLPFAMLPVMSVLAAPVPEPYAILDIGPPPEGETVEEYLQSKIRSLLHPVHGVALHVREDDAVCKLNSFAPQEDGRIWLTENLRVKAIPHTSYLRLEFRGGNREEQVVILNSFLRHYLRYYAVYRQFREKGHRQDEEYMAQLPKGSKPPEELQDRMSKSRTLIAAYKQIAVVRWAK
jgi:hypothetical protein